MNTNTLCTNKIHVIYCCPNCVNFLPENVRFLFIYLFIYFFWGGEGTAPFNHNSLSQLSYILGKRRAYNYVCELVKTEQLQHIAPRYINFNTYQKHNSSLLGIFIVIQISKDI